MGAVARKLNPKCRQNSCESESQGAVQGADDIIADTENSEVTVMGFQPGEDRLLITWEDQDPPEIDIEQDPENENLTRVSLNGHEVAHLFGADGLTVDDIHLLTEAELAEYLPAG